MKWLKIKKYLKIFSVIICSIFIFSNKTNALELNDGTIIPDLTTKPSEYYIIAEDENGKLSAIFYKSSVIKNYNGIENAITIDWPKGPDKNYTFNSDYRNTGGICHQYSSEDFDIAIYELENGEWIYKKSWDCWGYGIPGIKVTELPPGYEEGKNITEFIYENIDTQEIINYYNKYIKYSTVTIIKHYIGNNVYLDYENGYQIYPIEKENPLQYRMQFNNDISPDLKQITFDYPKSVYDNWDKIKARIEMGNWNENIEEIPKLENIKIVGYGIDGSEKDLSHIIGWAYKETDYITSNQIDFEFFSNPL